MSFAVLQGDFHPNEKGQEILKSILESLISSSFSFEYTLVSVAVNNEEINSSDYTKDTTIEELLTWLDSSDLPTRDYVEWAVAVEKTLFENGVADISYQTLEQMNKVLKKKRLEMESRGLEILVIERRIHYKDESSMHSKSTENDKLSLIPHLLLHYN